MAICNYCVGQRIWIVYLCWSFGLGAEGEPVLLSLWPGGRMRCVDQPQIVGL